MFPIEQKIDARAEKAKEIGRRLCELDQQLKEIDSFLDVYGKKRVEVKEQISKYTAAADALMGAGRDT